MQIQLSLLAAAISMVDLAAAMVKRGPANFEDAFTRPKETGVIVHNYVVQGISPVVTAAPVLLPRHGLIARQNTFARGPDTCAYFPDGYPLRCYSRDATCIYASPFAGCCDLPGSCSSIPTTCIDYTDVLKGSCDPDKITGYQTACCDKTAPNCVLHHINLGASDVGIWGCSVGTQAELLVTTNPANAPDDSTTPTLTHSDGTVSDSGATPVTPSTSGSSTGDASKDGGNDSGSSSTNVGAIAGGVIGGVAGLALIGAAIFLFMRSKKKEKAAGATSQPVMQQHASHGSPPPNGQGYNNEQMGYNQQYGAYGAYDPNKAYAQQQQGSPGPYSPGAYSPGYGQPQQAWGYPSPTEQNTSPGPAETVSPTTTNNQATAAELPSNRPTGSTDNRAELG